MRRSYLDNLHEHLAEPPRKAGPPSPTSTPDPTHRLQMFFALGRMARRQGLSLTEAMQTESIWSQLKSSSDREVAFFTAGLYGQESPALPVPARQEVVVPPKPEPAPVQQLATVPVASPTPLPQPAESLSAGELENEIKLLKTLVQLLEKKLAQPVTVVNEFKSPKIMRTHSTSEVARDSGDNIKGQEIETQYEYEDDK